MENLRASRYIILGFMAFVAVFLLFWLGEALRLGRGTAMPVPETPTLTLLETQALEPSSTATTAATRTLEAYPPPVTATVPPDVPLPTVPPPGYPGPGGSGSTQNTPQPLPTPTSAGGYPPPVAPTSAVETPAGYPGPTQAVTQTTGTPEQTATVPPAGTTPTTSGPLYLPCNLAEYVRDESYPDGTQVYPHETFTKRWLVRNGGSCTWNTGYDMIFQRGDEMDTKKAIPLAQSVAPSTFTELAITFLAPNTAGTARSFWMMRSDKGEEFGFGINRDQPIWVRVDVRAPDEGLAFDMLTGVCQARWRTRSGVQSCFGDPASSGGSISIMDFPAMEDDRVEDEPALWTRPGTFIGAFITGEYPKYTVQTGDHFKADVGCLQGYEECDIVFIVAYRDASGRERTLQSFEETYDGKVTRIDLDLSALAGDEIELILSVRNFGRADHAQPFWLSPGIRHEN
ncbi:MAG: NBR1-Ig-like domain-containing protein [Anaerolineales bacterium]